ncbi:DUF6113 family protein [Blastococcus sp. URHD0036]|uniref:DUF6113 family protein n=1 Tax=Blastococcus sp. URHD0036 TaxID=1380356 RepID=UPI0004958BF3|nr:DUF6113 family protein [Blastococcus sp. URHD0036]
MRAVAGGVLAVLLAAWFAVLEVFWLPLQFGSVPVPLSIPVAVAVNLLLVTGTHRLTGSRAAAVLPAVVWLVVVLPASQQRAEGDVLLIGDWRGLAFLLFGVLGASLAVGRVLGAPGMPAGRPAQGSGARR